MLSVRVQQRLVRCVGPHRRATRTNRCARVVLCLRSFRCMPSTRPTSGSGNLPPAPYHGHSRSQSQVKGESMTPPIASSYTPGALNSTPYSPSYAMDSSTSPVPPPPRQNSNSTPNTPFPYAHPSQSPGGGQYYSQDLMQVDVPQHKRRASGFRRVRDSRDLRPYVNAQPGGRRMDASGTFLSVCCAPF